jgi:lambda family phage portal protein
MKSQQIRLLDSHGRPMERARSPRGISATYDVSKWTSENAKQWSNVDSLSARAANSREVRRRLYQRARYERANNSYADGIVTTLADDTIGTGPHLHMNTEDDTLNAVVEEAWNRWATQIHLAIKLHTMSQSLTVDGEAFGLLNTNPAVEGPVQLDIKLIEADQIQTPWLNPVDPLAVDGIRYDVYFNPIEYSMLRYHPGDYFQIGYIADPIDARAMIHWFDRTRPGQCRGIPELTPALPLLPLLRRYTLAVLAAAETAADFAAVIESTLPPDPEDGGMHCEPFEHFEIERRTWMTLPDGYKASQIDPKQPAPSYDMFKNQILREVGRCLHMPFNKVAGDSSGYNYSSGRLDHQEYYKAITVRQSRCTHWVLEPIFKAWLVEMSLATDILEGGPLDVVGWKHRWFWDGHGHVDPEKEANAQETRLRNNTTTLAEESAKEGLDWETRLRQRAKEISLETQLGIRPPLLPQAEPKKPARSDEEDTPDDEEDTPAQTKSHFRLNGIV